jgi:hypothetical protein
MRARELLFAATLALAAAAAACTAASSGVTADGHGAAKPDCASCHMPEYMQVRHPVHVDAKPTTCGICHKQQGWHPSVVDHPWPLTGKHEKADCFKCHDAKPPKFKGTSKACYGCHKAEYDKPPFADHMLFQKACAECHTTADWKTLVPNPIWPPDETPKDVDAGPPDAGHEEPHDTHDAGAATKPKPKPKPQPQPLPPPDVTTGGSRKIHR